jgi:hypothetical protein
VYCRKIILETGSPETFLIITYDLINKWTSNLAAGTTPVVNGTTEDISLQ